ncbi:MAG: hypothetical protein QGF59_11325, partial [Pirellulaceae bacterium]|nr:hypothetical protein [Pirellulaceae bacterium]
IGAIHRDPLPWETIQQTVQEHRIDNTKEPITIFYANDGDGLSKLLKERWVVGDVNGGDSQLMAARTGLEQLNRHIAQMTASPGEDRHFNRWPR